VPGRNRPSFLKKQKEQQRRARATRKREERRARKHVANLNEPEPMAPEDAAQPSDEEAAEIQPGSAAPEGTAGANGGDGVEEEPR
jgi:hypothetical protein